MQTKHFLLLGAILVLVLGAGLFLHLKNKADSEIGGQSSSEEVATSVSISATGPHYTVELDSVVDIQTLAPDLNRKTQFGESIPQDIRANLQGKIEEILTRLKKDYYLADEWMMLGVLYHSANDYVGARDVWEFLLKVLGTKEKAIVYDNLGKLYKFDLKDFPKAETNFRASIQADPESVTPYIELFELYRYLYKKDTTAAIDVMNEARKKFPNNTDPLTLLASYYRDMKEYAKARAVYTEAMDLARAQGNLQLVSLIGEELADLPE